MDSSEQLISDLVTGVASVKLINPASKSALPKLDEENYLFWKFQSLITLRGHGLEEFVAPKVVAPSKHLPSTGSDESSSTPNPAYLQWLRQDNLITAWLVSSMPNSLISEMLDCQTASEVRAILAGRFSSRILARVMELKSKLETTKKGTSSLPGYFAQIKNIVDSLAAAGKRVSLDDHVMHILAGLGPEYDPTISVLSGDVETPSLQRVYSML